jgi:hypothetical protein
MHFDLQLPYMLPLVEVIKPVIMSGGDIKIDFGFFQA